MARIAPTVYANKILNLGNMTKKLGFHKASMDQLDTIDALIKRAFDGYVKKLRPDAIPGPYPWLKPEIVAGRVFVATSEGKIAGAICVKYEDKQLIIDQLAVDTYLQNSGVGGWLLSNIENYAHKMGKEKISLITADIMDDLLRFYSRHGYQKMGKFLHSDGRDKIFRIRLSKDINFPN